MIHSNEKWDRIRGNKWGKVRFDAETGIHYVAFYKKRCERRKDHRLYRIIGAQCPCYSELLDEQSLGTGYAGTADA